MLEQVAQLQFEATTHPATYGSRWLTIDAGDLDGDGDDDIVLGGGYVPVGLAVDHPELLKEFEKSGKALLYLENQTLK